MKRSNLSKVFSTGVLTLSMAILPLVMPLTLPASAQVFEPGVESEGIYETEDDFDWGWLGLIGLFGLAGLGGRKRQDTTAYRETIR